MRGKARCSSVLRPTRTPFWIVLKIPLMRQSFRRPQDASSCCRRFGVTRVSGPLSPPSFPAPQDRSITVCRLRALSSHRCPTIAPALASASPLFGVVSNRSHRMMPQVFLVLCFLPGRSGRGHLRIQRTPLFSLVRSPWPTCFGARQDAAGHIASERIDSKSNLSQTRIKVGVSHDFSGERKLGIYYSSGFVAADFRNVSHTLIRQPQSLDTTQSAGRYSDVGIRVRGVAAK